MTHVLEVRDLVTRFHTEQGVVRAVNGISYTLDRGEAMALVGESGSGKSVSVLSILGLLPRSAGQMKGRLSSRAGISGSSSAELRHVRGRDIAMVFQDPMTSLNPVLTVGRQLTEASEFAPGHDGAAARERAAELLDQVGIPDAGERFGIIPTSSRAGCASAR